MTERKKRAYNSQCRTEQAAQTRNRILDGAKKLFQEEGFEAVTIERLAQAATVSAPTVYALFQSKRGVLQALMDDALDPDQFDTLVKAGKKEKSATKRLAITGKIVRQIYDAEQAQMDIFRGAAILSPELKELERERELRRYQRQEEFIRVMASEGQLAERLTLAKARDILWALTGRDMYRLFVVERGWSSATYEKWLVQLLIKTLLKPDRSPVGLKDQ